MTLNARNFIVYVFRTLSQLISSIPLVELYICDSAVFCALMPLHDQLARLDRHVQLTRCFSAVLSCRNIFSGKDMA